MDGGMLSQEEINALMGGGDDSASTSAKGSSTKTTVISPRPAQTPWSE